MTFEKARNASRNNRKTRNTTPRSRTLVEKFEPRLLLAAAVGVVDVANRNTISGWAYDPDTKTASINVRITIDGANNTVAANQIRNDLIPVIGSANHGFSFTMPALAPGAHTVTISAADSSTGALKVLKTLTITNPAPRGAVDVINGTTVSGWGFDADAGASPVQIRIDNNGVAGTAFAASNARPDLAGVSGIVGTNHGFSVSGSFGIVDVYALDNPTGAATLLRTNSTKARGAVDIMTTNRIAGWAWTPDLGANPLTIEVWVDGVLFQSATTGVNRPDLVGITGQTNSGFDFNLNALTVGAHTVQVYAINSQTTSSNRRVLLKQATLTNKRPTGVLDVANSTGVSGWVFDPDAASTSIQYRIKVDGVTVTTATASTPRPDLTPVIGSPNHGFTSTLGALSAGPHKIELFALDAPSGQEILVQTKFINNNKPFGFLDIAGQVLVKGWAYDPDSPGTPVQVVVELDGVRDVLTPADDARNDLLSVLPDPNHAFTIQTPTHLTGTHTLRVIAIDTFTGEEVVLGTKVFTNRAPRGEVSLFAATGVAGWAQDPDQPFNSILVLVRIDGVIAPAAVITANRPTTAAVTRKVGSPNHGFAYSYAKLSRGAHFIEVFGVDSVTGVSTLIGSKRLVVA
jgi:hypothetical protein